MNKSAQNYLKSAITSATNDFVFNFRAPGKFVGELAKSILPHCDTLFFKDYATSLLKINLASFDTPGLKSTQRNGIFNKFHAQCLSDADFEEWKKIIKKIEVSALEDCMFSLFNFVMGSFLQNMLKHRNEILFGSTQKEIDVTLDADEEQTVRYIAGFVIYSLQNSLADKRTPAGRAAKTVLDLWAAKGGELDEDIENNETIYSYTEKWVNHVNRGGLYRVNDQFYLFVKEIELKVRSVLNNNLLVNYCNEDLRKVLTEKLSESQDIDLKWTELTRQISNLHLKQKMLKQIFRKWINVRTYHFVRTWIQISKRKQDKKKTILSEKGEPALRKTLSTKK